MRAVLRSRYNVKAMIDVGRSRRMSRRRSNCARMDVNLPEIFSDIPRHPLTYSHPSPIHTLPRLTSSVNNSSGPTSHASNSARASISLFVKREDQSSSLACAGNKYRKLEYLIPDILGGRVYADIDANIDLNSIVSACRTGNSASLTTGQASLPSHEHRTTTLVTEGAIQSNHTVQVASLAAHLGLESVVLLHRRLGGGYASTRDKEIFLRTGNVQILRLLGADVRILGEETEKAEESSREVYVGEDSHPPPSTAQTTTPRNSHTPASIIEELVLRDGKIPYWIPSGASLHPLGGLGYARCAFEIAMQEQQMAASISMSENGGNRHHNHRFDYIFVACGSGSTLGGLIAGFKLVDKLNLDLNRDDRNTKYTKCHHPRPPRQIIGILTSPTQPKAYHEARVLQFARTAARLIGLDPPNHNTSTTPGGSSNITMDDIRLDDRFVGSAYGVLDPELEGEALNRFGRKESLVLDPVYTVKVAKGMMHWVERGEVVRDYLSRIRRSRMGMEHAADDDDEEEEEEDDGHGGGDDGGDRTREKTNNIDINVLVIHTGGQAALSAYADVLVSQQLVTSL